MWQHWKEISAIFGVVGLIITWIVLILRAQNEARKEGKESGKADGTLSGQVCTLKKSFVLLSERVKCLEKEGFMTTEDHTAASDRCIRTLNQRRTEDRERLAGYEDLLHGTREMVIEVRGMVKSLTRTLGQKNNESS